MLFRDVNKYQYLAPDAAIKEFTNYNPLLLEAIRPKSLGIAKNAIMARCMSPFFNSLVYSPQLAVTTNPQCVTLSVYYLKLAISGDITLKYEEACEMLGSFAA